MKRYLSLLLLFAFMAGCREPYDLPLNNPPTGFLVVEGFINSAGPTTIQLSRTVPLSDSAQVKMEKGAQVEVQDRNGTRFLLSETAPGTYTIPSIPMQTGGAYRVFIRAAGKQYASAYTEVRTDPSLDSIRWEREGTGVRIFADSRDREGDNRYYMWQYEETWEIRSRFPSQIKYDYGNPPGRLGLSYRTGVGAGYDPSIFFCWKSFRSSRIMLANTVQLVEDKVQFPLKLIPNDDEQLSVLYHIRVRQIALDKAGYEFFDLMKKNTEDLGSIFDPQPSQTTGNIVSLTDAKEQVIGYVMVAAVREKTRFISNQEVPGWKYQQFCNLETVVENHPDSLDAAMTAGLIPTTPEIYGAGGSVVTTYMAEERCVDCTTRGTNRKPSFWP